MLLFYNALRRFFILLVPQQTAAHVTDSNPYRTGKCAVQEMETVPQKSNFGERTG